MWRSGGLDMLSDLGGDVLCCLTRLEEGDGFDTANLDARRPREKVHPRGPLAGRGSALKARVSLYA